MNPAAYIQAHVSVQASGCVEWTGYMTSDGYGMAIVGYAGKGRPARRMAHRVTYEMWVGEVPAGLDLDHLCRNRRCVNPLRLEPVTRRENVARGLLPQLMSDPLWRPRRAHIAVCKNGHDMAGDNLGHSGNRRVCRACKRETQRQIRRRSK